MVPHRFPLQAHMATKMHGKPLKGTGLPMMRALKQTRRDWILSSTQIILKH